MSGRPLSAPPRERACNISFSLVSYWPTLTPLATCEFQVFLFTPFHSPCIRTLVAPPSAFLFVPTPSLYPFGGGNLRYLQTLKTMRHSLRFASANELSKILPALRAQIPQVERNSS